MATINTELHESLVTDEQLARIAGVSARHIRRLAESGVLERAERGRYALAAAVQALIDNASNAGANAELVRQRCRKVKADADMAEIHLAEARKLIAPISEMQRAMEGAFVEVRARMRQIPVRAIMQLIHEGDERVWKAKLLHEIDTALVAVAQADMSKVILTDETPTEDETA